MTLEELLAAIKALPKSEQAELTKHLPTGLVKDLTKTAKAEVQTTYESQLADLQKQNAQLSKEIKGLQKSGQSDAQSQLVQNTYQQAMDQLSGQFNTQFQQLQQQLKMAEVAAAKSDVIAEYGLPLTMKNLIHGNSPAELQEAALYATQFLNEFKQSQEVEFAKKHNITLGEAQAVIAQAQAPQQQAQQPQQTAQVQAVTQQQQAQPAAEQQQAAPLTVEQILAPYAQQLQQMQQHQQVDTASMGLSGVARNTLDGKSSNPYQQSQYLAQQIPQSMQVTNHNMQSPQQVQQTMQLLQQALANNQAAQVSTNLQPLMQTQFQQQPQQAPAQFDQAQLIQLAQQLQQAQQQPQMQQQVNPLAPVLPNNVIPFNLAQSQQSQQVNSSQQLQQMPMTEYNKTRQSHLSASKQRLNGSPKAYGY